MASFLSNNYWSSWDHDLMARIWEKAISILSGNLNSGRSYLITAVHTSWINWLCLSTFLLFIILTIAACRYILRSSSTAWWVCSTSWGVSFWTVPAIRNLVRLLVYFIFKPITDSSLSSWNEWKRKFFNDRYTYIPIQKDLSRKFLFDNQTVMVLHSRACENSLADFCTSASLTIWFFFTF